MIIKVLGTGNAFNQEARFNSAFLIEIDNATILVDCGFTVPLALQKESIEFSSLDYIVITHYHGDHYAGLASLLLGLKYVSPQYKKLTIVGPGNISEKLKGLFDVLYPGTCDLINELNIDMKSVDFFGDKLQTKDFNLMVHPMVHSDLALPVGYVFEKNGFKIGFSGDTSWHDGLNSFIGFGDKLIIECNFVQKTGDGHISIEELESSELVQIKKKDIYLTHLCAESANKAKELGYNILSDGDNLCFKI